MLVLPAAMNMLSLPDLHSAVPDFPIGDRMAETMCKFLQSRKKERFGNA